MTLLLALGWVEETERRKEGRAGRRGGTGGSKKSRPYSRIASEEGVESGPSCLNDPGIQYG